MPCQKLSQTSMTSALHVRTGTGTDKHHKIPAEFNTFNYALTHSLSHPHETNHN